MAIGDAKKFINEIMVDSSLRDEFIRIETMDEMDSFLSRHKYAFDNNEFEDGFNNLLVNCQHESLADYYYQIKFIYETVVSDFHSPCMKN